MKTEEILLIAEHVNLIGPGSRTHDLHDAIERFYRIATEMAVDAEQDPDREVQPLYTPAAPSQDPYKDSTPHLSEKEALR